MKYKVYLSDEGFGHLVRQRAVYDAFRHLAPDIHATVQTGSREEAARRIFSNADFVHRFNNISWSRNADGSPNLEGIRDFFSDYIQRSESFIEGEESLGKYRFVVSDFVYEAFALAHRAGLPAFGVAHFTWDWFFSRLYPAPVDTAVIQKLQQLATLADVIFFPPFTPEEILSAYRASARSVPFIVHERDSHKTIDSNGKFTVMIMDSGANVLSEHIEAAVKTLGNMRDIHFIVAEKYGITGDNISTIPDHEFFSDYISGVDLVITRGGFNTISECIAYRTPLLLLGEALNPEIEKNLLYVKQEGLGSFTSLNRFVNNLEQVLYQFINAEYDYIRTTMDQHDYRTDGARVIAEDILNRVGTSRD